MAKAIPEQAYSEALFVYGALQDTAVQIRLIGREVMGEVDILPGWQRFFPPDYAYPMLRQSSQDSVAGRILFISPAELQHFDAYEGPEYERVRVVLASGAETWVYVSSGLVPGS